VRNASDKQKFSERMGGLVPYLRRTWLIPGLDSSFVPQGIALVDGRDSVVLSYYSKSRPPEASALVVVDLSSARVRTWVRLHASAREPVLDHVGGVAILGNHVFTGGGGVVRRFSLEGLLAARRGASLHEKGCFAVDSRMSNLSADGERLWIGEYHGREHHTARHHHRGPHRAWVAAYDIDPATGAPVEAGTYMVGEREVLRPALVLFTPDHVQGVARRGDVFVLSISAGNTGTLRFFRSPLLGPPLAAEVPGGGTLRAYILDEPYAILPIPSGAEDLAWGGDHLYTTFESACRMCRHVRERGAVLEDRFYELAVPRPIEEDHTVLVERTRFSVDSEETRTLRFPFEIPGGHGVVKVGIGDAEDDAGDQGLTFELADSEGRVAHRGFLRGKEIAWVEQELAGAAKWELRLIDSDTKFDSKWPGNGGTIEVWLRRAR
jgi:hypothetical protein